MDMALKIEEREGQMKAKSAIEVVALCGFSIFLIFAKVNGQVSVGSGKEEGNAEIKNLISRYNIGVTQLEDENYEKALNLFKELSTEVSSLNLNDDDKRKLIASIENNAGNAVLLTFGSSAEAETHFRKAIEAVPKHSMAWNNLGVALLRQTKVEEAVKSFKLSFEKDSRNNVPLNNLAELLIKGGQVKEAAKILKLSLAIEETNERTLLLLAMLYSKAKMPDQEKTVWQTIINLSNNSLSSRIALGTNYLREGFIENAETIFREILKENPSSQEARLQLLRVKAKKGALEKAENELRGMLVDYPGDPILKNDHVAILLQMNRDTEAEEKALDAVRLFPDDAESWFVLGRCAEKMRKLKEAKDYYQKTVQFNPGHSKGWNNLGILAARSEDANQAIEYFKRAIAADPYNLDSQYNLARTLIISKLDYRQGVLLLAKLGLGNSETAERARALLNTLEKIANTSD